MLEEYYDCVGEGWKTILESLDKTFTSILNHAKRKTTQCEVIVNKVNDEDLTPRIIINQIKEKFGGLRVYVEFYNLSDNLINETYGAILMAENLAIKTCESCGTTKDVALRGKGWVKTFCESCETIRKGKRI